MALGYFVSYLPDAALVKALSLGVDAPIGDLVLLPGQLIAVLCIVGVVVALSYPALRGMLGGTMAPERMVLFVCGGNQLPGAPIADAAAAILEEAGVIPQRHRSRPLTPAMCRRADAIYCMTAEHRAAVRALAPEVVDRTHCLAEDDIPEPSASLGAHRRTATAIQRAVRARLAEQFS